MNDRSEFSFSKEVKSKFAFLEDNGFLCSLASSNKVRYKSNKVYIDIAHGERDGEVSITFGRSGTQEEFSFTLFLRLVNPNLERKFGEQLADKPEQINECLTKLSNVLSCEGKSIIYGDDAIFERMKDVRWWDFKPEALIRKN